MVAGLKDNMAAYDEARGDLEMEHLGEWSVFYDRKLVGTYQTSEEAAENAVRRFGRGPYLIRRIGADSARLPASFQIRDILA